MATIWYGPHQCSVCGELIVKAAREQGGDEYDAPPSGQLYPNHVWVPHIHGHTRQGEPQMSPPNVPPLSVPSGTDSGQSRDRKRITILEAGIANFIEHVCEEECSESGCAPRRGLAALLTPQTP